jgi:hypothetical protein
MAMNPLPILQPNRSRTTIYDGARMFLGRKDLVVSFYTEKCQFQCAYCALPMRSANEPVSVDDLNAQIEATFDKYRDELASFQQLSFGNEGSALDRARFFPASLDLLLERTRAMTSLEVLSIETRPEYVEDQVLADIVAHTHARVVDVTIGFETQDDRIRREVLRKSISRRQLDDRLAILGRQGVRLTSYVMVKPAPNMTEDDGVREALATIEYLVDRCAHHRTDLVVYLTPSYIADGSSLHRTTRREDYLPPTIQSIFRVIVLGRRFGVPIYTGVWHEGLADDGNDFRGRDGYDPLLRKAIVQFNRTDDFSHLEPFVGMV